MKQSPIPPTGWGEDNLGSFMETCIQNTYATFQVEREWYNKLSKINDIYHILADNLNEDPEWFGGFFVLHCHAAFLGACRCAFAGQLPETYMVLRGCLEAALYGFYLAKNPDLRRTWLDRHENEASRKKAKSEFTIARLKQCLAETDRETHDRLSEYYEHTIDLGGHPNAFSVLSHQYGTDNHEEKEFTLHYLHPHTNLLLATFKVCAVVGLTGLDVFRNVYPQHFDSLGLNHQILVQKRGL